MQGGFTLKALMGAVLWMRMARTSHKKLRDGIGAHLCLTLCGGLEIKHIFPLLCLIPLFNIVWIFVVGFKGNEWAWQKNDYKDIETFKAVQATWNRAGLVNFIISILFVLIYIFFLSAIISGIISSMDNY